MIRIQERLNDSQVEVARSFIIDELLPVLGRKCTKNKTLHLGITTFKNDPHFLSVTDTFIYEITYEGYPFKLLIEYLWRFPSTPVTFKDKIFYSSKVNIKYPCPGLPVVGNELSIILRQAICEKFSLPVTTLIGGIDRFAEPFPIEFVQYGDISLDKYVLMVNDFDKFLGGIGKRKSIKTSARVNLKRR